MWLKKQIPNSITLLNLLSGCIAVIFAVQNNLPAAAFFVMAGIGFDFLDGFAARILKAQSELGLQLDSLADMVTSGVVPGIVMYQLLSQVFGKPFYIQPTDWSADEIISSFDLSYISLIGLFITLASAYRLAKFNIDTRQTTSFIGLPTPANTLVIISLPLILKFQPEDWVVALILNKWFLIGLTIVSCYLLNAEIRLFALKFKTWGFAENKVRYFFLLLTIILIILLKFIAIPCAILLYVLMSLFFVEKE
ncbi:CDP-alcohol phosphatidyltransferase family protein [Aquimarina sp. 2201CG5-10]|uniref:CDP-alcohol phosphatidyltransferase family protein n=1 Tax=Aquimarina callyspongiae TaxID=3098150 RepID=UPI002AB4BB30|nr:CDP-alcohol phosphatidyltransferase family protein [Aquimarina sp. 2201CG5-10]MDY8137844.1 CDP-alcohol phosphatidyltransferase family protein [Aquimarina sp. 2201CG5-10]